MKKILAVVLTASFLLALSACGSGGTPDAGTGTGAGTQTSGTQQNTPEPAAGAGGETNSPAAEINVSDITFDQLNVGTDYTDITAEIRFKTHRTDLVDTILPDYIKNFQAMYPNVTISYEPITDYAAQMTTRMSTPEWGDICMIPTTIPLTELHNYLHPLGDLAVLAERYNFADNRAFGGISYGLPSTSNVQGILYNKAVFAAAGITEIPKTPEEFLTVLQTIKDNTDAIPLYTNFAAGWTMGAWDAYIGGSATGDPNFMNQVLPHAKDPFSDRGDGTGPYAVYNVLYEAVKRGLVEDDPTTTDWEGCKGMINRGEIGTMVLGSWAIVQMQEAGDNGADIGYMSFPITVNGKQYASAGPDYAYGINKNSEDDVKLASMLYIKYLIEMSNFDYDQGGIPTVKEHALPDTLAAFDGIELVADNPALAGEEDLFVNINVDSEVGLNMENQHVISIVENVLTDSLTFDEIAAGWNERWTAAQGKYGVSQ